MENSLSWEMYVKNANMGNMDEIEECALDLSMSARISREESCKPKKIKTADDQVVATTNEHKATNIVHGWSGLSSVSTYYSTNAAGSSLNPTPSCSYTYRDSLTSPVFLKPNHDFITPELHLSLSNAALNENVEVLQKKKVSDSNTVLSNTKFYTLLEPLQEKISEASVRIQSLISSSTEADMETELGFSTVFTQFREQFTPYMNAIKNAVEVIPKVLQSVPTNYVEIAGEFKKFLICQSSYERAVSKNSAKDAALVLVECDRFIPRKKKLASTIGRTSKCVSTGTRLKPLNSDILTAIYKIIADKSKMVNIQRVDTCSNASPAMLTLCEQKTVRDALSQYLNQLRQREKRKKKADSDWTDDNEQRCMHCK